MINPNSKLELLNTIDEKVDILKNLGLDYLIIHEFSVSFSNIDAEEFVKILIQKLNVRKLIVGYDHRFGKNRNANINDLKKFGNKDVDLFRDWLIVSNFQVVSDLVENSITIDNNEFGKIQILKAQGQKCDRCWHYQKETFSGIQNTKLCKRCSNIINLEFI